MNRKTRKLKCQCETRWTVNFGDDRGWHPSTSLVAATAAGVGLPVRLESVSKSPFRPLTPMARIVYAGAKEFIAEACEVCGYPTRMEKVA